MRVEGCTAFELLRSIVRILVQNGGFRIEVWAVSNFFALDLRNCARAHAVKLPAEPMARAKVARCA
jgi:hypothetical protein